ncbi:16730_t:CDS:2, partial [Acaulospora colombiana]
DSFMNDGVMSMLQELVRRNDMTDQKLTKDILLAEDSNAFIPMTLGQIFLVIVLVINEILKRIKSASSNITMCKIAKKLEELKKE